MLTTLNLDHDAMIDPVTISLTRLTVHCDATHTRSPTISVESACSLGIIRRWFSSTFTNSPSHLNCPVAMWGSPTPRILPPSLPPHRRILVRHPTSLTGLDHSFLLRNLHQRRRNTNPMPLTRSRIELYSLSGRPVLKISNTTGFSST